MKTSRIVQIILNCLIIAIFLAAGAVILILRHFAYEYDVVLLGTILLISGAARAVVYFINKGYKHPRDITLISSIIMIGLGVVYIVSKKDVEVLCFGWGIMEIVLGSIESYIDTLQIKDKEYIAWFELVLNVTTVVFGILLCMHLSEGLTLHIIFLGISLLLYGTIALIKFVGSLREKE